jgi:hypothetical protein
MLVQRLDVAFGDQLRQRLPGGLDFTSVLAQFQLHESSS